MKKISKHKPTTLQAFLLGACIGVLALPVYCRGQQPQQEVLPGQVTLQQAITYAISHQPDVQKATLDEQIAEKTISGKLADWFPQINLGYTYQHNFQLPITVIGDNLVPLGVDNTSNLQFNGTQTLFNRDVLLASSTASQVRQQTRQLVKRSKMDIHVAVTKAFYDVLTSHQQIRIGEEDIIRLRRSFEDATRQFEGGLTDKTDYKRADILLTNATASLAANRETLRFKEDFLKRQMGYPMEQPLNITYDTLQMEQDIQLQTGEQVNYHLNIDYQVLQTQRTLQEANVKYNYWSFIPNVNVYGAYILNYQNQRFSDLYNNKYPNSYAGVSLSLPLFQGNKRLSRIQEQRLTLHRVDWELTGLQNNITAEYTRSVAAYQSYLQNYLALKKNVALSKEVYEVIRYQYLNGIRSYLDVTIAETELRSSRINYFNALYMVLSSKLDVQRVSGQIEY